MTKESESSVVIIEPRRNNKLIIRLPYNQELIRNIRTISRRRLNPKEKYWEASYDENLIPKLQTFFGECLIVHPYFYLISLQKELSIRKYSRRSIKSYMKYNWDFLLFARKKLEEIGNEDSKKYFYYIVELKKNSTSILNIILNALKFYYREILKKDIIFEVKRPKKDKKSPIVSSREEIIKILQSSSNIKHRAIHSLVYSAGLRIGEVVKLKPEDIDFDRRLIYIRGSKGRKDRYILLSNTALKILRKYFKEYEPSKWLFEGAGKGKHISTRTVQAIFRQACKKAEVNKDVTVHSSRHSFAIHFLEGGVDLRYNQEILAHKNSKTTEIYAHVNRTNLAKIENPLDRLMKEGRI